jgi:hypothetical protein
MGIGVIDPVDEITDSTVPSNAPLMEFLEQTMKDVNYDLRAYLRVPPTPRTPSPVLPTISPAPSCAA